MDLFDYADELQYGELHLEADPTLGLRSIVAIHNLNLGPAIGGCRFIEYDTSEEALRDAMRLGRGMTYKAALAGLDHGGGKAVIMRPKNLDEDQRRRIFEEFGGFVDSLAGDYVTCEDSGTTVGDMNVVKDQTEHVLGYGKDEGGSGDPSPVTAYGVRRGIEAAAQFKFGDDNLDGVHVAIQGVGSVGYYLARELDELGANLTVTDVDDSAISRCVEEFGAEAVQPDAIFEVDCDIFAPCALGAVINDKTIPRLKCDVVAGAANNQLKNEDRHDVALKERGILYAPDYAINAGGLINVAEEFTGYDRESAMSKTKEIYGTMHEIYERAEAEDDTTANVADRIAEERVFG